MRAQKGRGWQALHLPAPARIVRIHLKDFKRKGYQWTNLLEGDVNWPQVRKALAEISYQGHLTTELRAGDEAYLTDLAKRIDKIIAMPSA